MARKKKHEEHENHERWLVSYADFITLLFAFFVVMYSVSSVNEGKYRVLSDALVAAFRAPPSSMAPIQVGVPNRGQSSTLVPNPRERPIKMPMKQLKDTPQARPKPAEGKDSTGAKDIKTAGDPTGAKDIKEAGDRAGDARPNADDAQAGAADKPSEAIDPQLAEMTAEQAALAAQLQGQTRQQTEVAITVMAREIEEAMRPLIDDRLIKVKRDKLWMEIEINSSILFDSGSAHFATTALPILDELAAILRPYPNPIHIEGHTDNLPIATLEYPSNWELSAGRAATVVRLFTQQGILPQRLAAIGYGEFRPVADNADAEGRGKNRRVVLVVRATEEMRHADQAPADATADPAPAMPAASVPEAGPPPSPAEPLVLSTDQAQELLFKMETSFHQDTQLPMLMQLHAPPYADQPFPLSEAAGGAFSGPSP